MKQCFFALALSILLIIPVHSQEIITADRFLQMVSEHYSTIMDYEANIIVRSGNSVMPGTISYLAPSSLRIDFTQPANQVILFNGDMLTVFIPGLQVVLNQNVAQNRAFAGANLASAEGLNLLRRNYIPTFVTGPEPVNLDANSNEQVVKLRLVRRNVSEGFREIILSINPNTNLIRRIAGTTIAGVNVQFDFTDIRVNQGIPEMRFVYTPPAGANTIHNFMFRDMN
ncbi:MAG: outer-membrane lipoprotein carrier protein LolA [Treponema sp.]|nr:outer-membrane lipoprotein carrier protein LolA [Treponema sp.]